MTERVPAGPGTRVSLRFTLSLENGDIIDSSGDQAAVFEMGDGKLMPGFEKAIFGMRQGDQASLRIGVDQGFGQPNPNNIHLMKRSLFRNMKLETGLVVSFADGEGHERPGVVTRLAGEDRVEVDFNHPLAGKELTFDVEILAVEQISDEILRM